MDERHPKRRKDKNNPYTLSIADGRFYLSFRDGVGVFHEMEIDGEMYRLLNAFELEDLSYLNEWDRHIEQSEPSEETLEQRMHRTPCTVEETVYKAIQHEQLHIKSCSEIDRVLLEDYLIHRATDGSSVDHSQ